MGDKEVTIVQEILDSELNERNRQIKYKRRKILKAGLEGKESSQAFGRTLKPRMVLIGEENQGMTMMDYNLYVNRRWLNNAVEDILEHYGSQKFPEKMSFWMFCVKMENGRVVVCNTKSLLKMDSVRLIHYLNKEGLAEKYKCFDWARDNSYYMLPEVHEYVAYEEELAEWKNLKEYMEGWVVHEDED